MVHRKGIRIVFEDRCKSFTLCQGTGAPAVNGRCVVHGGDACLMLYINFNDACEVVHDIRNQIEAGMYNALEDMKDPLLEQRVTVHHSS